MAKFSILGGQHIQDGPDGRERKYFRGDIVESGRDLATRWPEKFQRVFDETPSSPGILTKPVVATEETMTPMKAPPGTIVAGNAPPVGVPFTATTSPVSQPAATATKTPRASTPTSSSRPTRWRACP